MSLRLRLTLWYGALFVLALAMLGLGTHALMQDRLAAQTRSDLVTQASYVVNNYEFVANAHNRLVPALPPLNAFTTSGVYVQLVASDLKLRQRSPSLAHQWLPVDARAFHEATADGTPSFRQVNLAGNPVEVYYAPLRLSASTKGRAGYVVMVGKSLVDVRRALNTVTAALIGGGAVMLALVVLITWLVARAALRPIEAMTGRAAAIAATRNFAGRVSESEGSRSSASELERLALTFNHMLASLEEAYAAQQRFLADASHELRTPLTTVQANLEYLESAIDAPPVERALALHAARMESERMGMLVSDLLALSRADTGQGVERKPVELDRVLVDAYRRVKPRSATDGDGTACPRLTIGHLDEIVVQGDADRLLQLIMILLDNALKYTPSDGTVVLSLRRVSPTRAAICVEDSGIGIAPEDRERIFERFYRSAPARAQREGSGLGLAIAQWIARAHGGDITIDDSALGGATFVVTLPSIATASTSASTTEERTPTLAGS